MKTLLNTVHAASKRSCECGRQVWVYHTPRGLRCALALPRGRTLVCIVCGRTLLRPNA